MIMKTAISHDKENRSIQNRIPSKFQFLMGVKYIFSNQI